MDATISALISNAEQACSVQDQHNKTERALFEEFMFNTFMRYRYDETKQYYLRRDPNYHDRYAETQMENMWWVWKSRAAIARGELPEAYPE